LHKKSNIKIIAQIEQIKPPDEMMHPAAPLADRTA